MSEWRLSHAREDNGSKIASTSNRVGRIVSGVTGDNAC